MSRRIRRRALSEEESTVSSENEDDDGVDSENGEEIGIPVNENNDNVNDEKNLGEIEKPLPSIENQSSDAQESSQIAALTLEDEYNGEASKREITNKERKAKVEYREGKKPYVRKDPSAVPKSGRFFLHDDRETDVVSNEKASPVKNSQAVERRRNDDADVWKHDKFDQSAEIEQRPREKSRAKNNEKERHSPGGPSNFSQQGSPRSQQYQQEYRKAPHGNRDQRGNERGYDKARGGGDSRRLQSRGRDAREGGGEGGEGETPSGGAGELNGGAVPKGEQSKQKPEPKPQEWESSPWASEWDANPYESWGANIPSNERTDQAAIETDKEPSGEYYEVSPPSEDPVHDQGNRSYNSPGQASGGWGGGGRGGSTWGRGYSSNSGRGDYRERVTDYGRRGGGGDSRGRGGGRGWDRDRDNIQSSEAMNTSSNADNNSGYYEVSPPSNTEYRNNNRSGERSANSSYYGGYRGSESGRGSGRGGYRTNYNSQSYSSSSNYSSGNGGRGYRRGGQNSQGYLNPAAPEFQPVSPSAEGYDASFGGVGESTGPVEVSSGPKVGVDLGDGTVWFTDYNPVMPPVVPHAHGLAVPIPVTPVFFPPPPNVTGPPPGLSPKLTSPSDRNGEDNKIVSNSLSNSGGQRSKVSLDSRAAVFSPASAPIG